MRTIVTLACGAVIVAVGGWSNSAAQRIDRLDDVLIDDVSDGSWRIAQRPRPSRQPDDVPIPRDPARDHDGRDRATRDRPEPRSREVRPIPPGPARLEARLEAVERKLDRILQELRRIEGRDSNRDPAPRPRIERLPADRFGGPPMRDPLERRSERARPQVERFPPRPPDAPRRDSLPPLRRPDFPSEDRFERRPDRRPLPLARPRPPQEREWDRPDGD
jgi:hypothetical protein